MNAMSDEDDLNPATKEEYCAIVEREVAREEADTQRRLSSDRQLRDRFRARESEKPAVPTRTCPCGAQARKPYEKCGGRLCELDKKSTRREGIWFRRLLGCALIVAVAAYAAPLWYSIYPLALEYIYVTETFVVFVMCSAFLLGALVLLILIAAGSL